MLIRIISKRIYLAFFTLTFIVITFVQSGFAQTSPIYNTKSIFHPVVASNGMVASQEKLATQAGLQVLKEETTPIKFIYNDKTVGADL